MGSSQCLQDTAYVILLSSSTWILGLISLFFKALTIFFSPELAKTAEETTLTKFDPLTAKDVFDEAKAGDEVALSLVDEVCEILGSALSNMACVVNPEIVVVGGGVSKAGSILIDCIQKHFVETCFYACRETKFAAATLGNDAGMYGCVKLLLG